MIYYWCMKLKSKSNKLTVTNKKRTVRSKEVDSNAHKSSVATVGVPGLFEPNEHDIRDELSRLESYSMRSYY
jgi:hypothetical protein